jgi:hypothetical protein
MDEWVENDASSSENSSDEVDPGASLSVAELSGKKIKLCTDKGEDYPVGHSRADWVGIISPSAVTGADIVSREDFEKSASSTIAGSIDLVPYFAFITLEGKNCNKDDTMAALVFDGASAFEGKPSDWRALRYVILSPSEEVELLISAAKFAKREELVNAAKNGRDALSAETLAQLAYFPQYKDELLSSYALKSVQSPAKQSTKRQRPKTLFDTPAKEQGAKKRKTTVPKATPKPTSTATELIMPVGAPTPKKPAQSRPRKAPASKKAAPVATIESAEATKAMSIEVSADTPVDVVAAAAVEQPPAKKPRKRQPKQMTVPESAIAPPDSFEMLAAPPSAVTITPSAALQETESGVKLTVSFPPDENMGEKARQFFACLLGFSK